MILDHSGIKGRATVTGLTVHCSSRPLHQHVALTCFYASVLCIFMPILFSCYLLKKKHKYVIIMVLE